MSDVDTTYGRTFLGLIISAILFGVTILQTFLYYRNYPKDPKFIKIMVFVLWALDLAQLVLSTITIYWYLVTNFNNPPALAKTFWSMNVQTDCNGLIGLIVECFFARRVFILSKNYFLTGVILLLSLIHFALGIVFTIDSFALPSASDFDQLIWVTSAGLGSAAAADILVAISLCYYLLKSKTGFSRTDSLITTLTIYSLTTGLVTSVLATMVVITFAARPKDYIWEAFFWLLGKFYVNSLLATLNSRDSLRERATPKETFLHLSGFQLGPTTERGSMSQQSVGPLVVAVEREMVTKSDYLESPISIGTSSMYMTQPAGSSI